MISVDIIAEIVGIRISKSFSQLKNKVGRMMERK
jgi:hypothetical protein